jgi:hypothetical protein
MRKGVNVHRYKIESVCIKLKLPTKHTSIMELINAALRRTFINNVRIEGLSPNESRQLLAMETGSDIPTVVIIIYDEMNDYAEIKYSLCELYKIPLPILSQMLQIQPFVIVSRRDYEYFEELRDVKCNFNNKDTTLFEDVTDYVERSGNVDLYYTLCKDGNIREHDRDNDQPPYED